MQERNLARVGVLYDIHANLPALEAVLHDLRQAGVGRVVVGGDVLPGPMPRETIARLLNLDIPVHFIRGNGDREVLARMQGAELSALPEQAREAVAWTAGQLLPCHEELLAGWPETLRLRIHGLGEVLFCHATPRNDTDVFTRRTPESRLRPLLAGLDVPLVICGHSHMQFDRMIGGIRVVNAGSVGMPFGEPGADWLLLEPGVRLRRTRYDLERAAGRIRKTEYPQADDFAARNVLHPPAEEAMLEAFSLVELK